MHHRDNKLKDIPSKSKGKTQYDWEVVQYIQSKEQFINWIQFMADFRRAPQKHYFKEMEVHGIQQLKGLATQKFLLKYL